jgi:dihydroorotase-like cyclic amidohydrolase
MMLHEIIQRLCELAWITQVCETAAWELSSVFTLASFRQEKVHVCSFSCRKGVKSLETCQYQHAALKAFALSRKLHTGWS